MRAKEGGWGPRLISSLSFTVLAYPQGWTVTPPMALLHRTQQGRGGPPARFIYPEVYRLWCVSPKSLVSLCLWKFSLLIFRFFLKKKKKTKVFF